MDLYFAEKVAVFSYDLFLFFLSSSYTRKIKIICPLIIPYFAEKVAVFSYDLFLSFLSSYMRKIKIISPLIIPVYVRSMHIKVIYQGVLGAKYLKMRKDSNTMHDTQRSYSIIACLSLQNLVLATESLNLIGYK